MLPLRILVVGAHPDDADYKAGGTSALWRQFGTEVKFVSVTNGGAGHHLLSGETLVARRRAEAQAAAAVIGATYDVLDNPDGALLPTLEARHQLIGLIRSFKPDLLLTHRPNDYHPDHRYTSMLVQDAAYLLTVPAICPDVPHLQRDPVILYLSDDFKKPIPFRADVVVDIGPQLNVLIDMLHCHASQFYEWLPYNSGHADQVPDGDTPRREWLKQGMQHRIRPLADRHRDRVVQTYGVDRGHKIEHIEVFEICEYGSPLDDAARARLFPFLPVIALGDAAPVENWSDLRDEE